MTNLEGLPSSSRRPAHSLFSPRSWEVFVPPFVGLAWPWPLALLTLLKSSGRGRELFGVLTLLPGSRDDIDDVAPDLTREGG